MIDAELVSKYFDLTLPPEPYVATKEEIAEDLRRGMAKVRSKYDPAFVNAAIEFHVNRIESHTQALPRGGRRLK